MKSGPLMIGIASVCCVLEKFEYHEFEMEWLSKVHDLLGIQLIEVKRLVGCIYTRLHELVDDKSTAESEVCD